MSEVVPQSSSLDDSRKGAYVLMAGVAVQALRQASLAVTACEDAARVLENKIGDIQTAREGRLLLESSAEALRAAAPAIPACNEAANLISNVIEAVENAGNQQEINSILYG